MSNPDLFENQEDPSELLEIFKSESKRIMNIVKAHLEYSGNEFQGLDGAISIFINNTCSGLEYEESTYGKYGGISDYRDTLESSLINVENIAKLVLTANRSAAFDTPEGEKVILSMLTSAKFGSFVNELELVDLDEL